MKKILLFPLYAILFSALVISCGDDDDMDEETLYDRLGGTTMVDDPANPGQMIEQGRLGLRGVVDSTIFVIVGEGQITSYFETLLTEVGNGNTTNLAVLSENLTDFFCVATGAENFEYTGMNMKDAHDPAQNPRMNGKVDDMDMDIFIQSVVTGAQQNNVPSEIITEVGEILETTRADIVQR